MQLGARRASLRAMGRQIVLSVLLGGVVCLGLLPALDRLRGWKALALPFLAIGAIIVAWGCIGMLLPR
jgi:hypothetical protein